MADSRGLWGHADFRRFWFGQSVSLVGSQVTHVALPLTGAVVLNASASEMGVLAALQFAPFLLFSLFAGVLIDRVRRRPLIVAADSIRGLLLATVPLAALFGVLGLPQLWVVAFLGGVCHVVSQTAQGSYLPALVAREHVVEANSKLAMSLSVARIAGPGLGGFLVQAVTAPIAIAVDAVSFAVSAASVAAIRAPEPAPAPPAERRGVWRDIREGMAVVLGQPVLRAISLTVPISNFADAMYGAVLMLYFTRVLELEPATLGLVLLMNGPGTLLGSVLAPRLSARLGPGPALIAAASCFLVGTTLVPLAASFLAYKVPIMVVAFLLLGLGNPIFNVTTASIRQAITPDHLLGRVGATGTFLAWGLMPFGALVGGQIGDHLGLQAALVVAAGGYVVLFLGLLASAVRTTRHLPAYA